MTTTFYRAPYLNPFLFDGKLISKIAFYADGKVIAQTNWFGNGYNSNIAKMVLPFEIRRSTKLNLDRKDAFYMVDKDASWDKEYIVYIHKDLVNLQFVRTRETTHTWNYTATEDFYTVDIENIVNGEPLKQISFSTNCKHLKTKEGARVEKLANEINKALGYDKLSSYDIHTLLQSFDITPKKEK